MINWRIQPKPADTTIFLHVSCERDGTTPKNIEVKSNLCIEKNSISEIDNRLDIFWPLARWIQQHKSMEKKTKPRRTKGQTFTIGLYFYEDGRPIEMRSNTGDNELVKKFVSVAMDWLVDEGSLIQLNPMSTDVES
ncbi:MAG: hypothetical protein UV60_C0004G0037 [Parcubacteria group bacterium GW2011_GWA2_43_11]|nr:MAG: hypothetical protein UU89_C0017G0032 [Parcubacteria group bacterium GW2011_GWC2_42_11]KKS85960.1 MAG: hypothetical protein UV60_C0004G0037 [Parcubacteria group bacterium GW2011_GWA2_43_11]